MCIDICIDTPDTIALDNHRKYPSHIALTIKKNIHYKLMP